MSSESNNHQQESHKSLHHHHHHHHDHKVTFPKDSTTGHGEGVDFLTAHLENDELSVKLGLLQVRHYYRVNLVVPQNLLTSTETTRASYSNEHCKLVSSSESPEGVFLTVEIFTVHDKTYKGELSVEYSTGKWLNLILHGTVFGKYDGCPRLSAGVHCIGRDKADDSDSSS